MWKVRIAGGVPEQVTRDPGPEFVNDWSPDGNSIAFSNGTGGGADLYNVSILMREGNGSPWDPPRRLSPDRH